MHVCINQGANPVPWCLSVLSGMKVVGRLGLSRRLFDQQHQQLQQTRAFLPADFKEKLRQMFLYKPDDKYNLLQVNRCFHSYSFPLVGTFISCVLVSTYLLCYFIDIDLYHCCHSHSFTSYYFLHANSVITTHFMKNIFR